MQKDVSLSDFNQTLLLYSLACDRESNIIISEDIFNSIILSFFQRIKSTDDKQLALRYLIQKFPNNSFLIEQNQLIYASKFWLRKFWTDSGLKENLKTQYHNELFQSIRQNQDWQRLASLTNDDEFFLRCRIPKSLRKIAHLFDKLERHSFKLIDLLENLNNPAFQLNHSMLIDLLFFFFPPQVLENQFESLELYRFLGEILCQCWLQIEFHLQQLLLKNQYDEYQKIVQEIPKFLVDDIKIFKNNLKIIFQSLQKKKQIQITFRDIEDLVLNNGPLNQNVFTIFYWICLFCQNLFKSELEIQNAQVMLDNKYLLLIQYIAQRKQFSTHQLLQIQLQNRLKEYTNEQNKIFNEWGKNWLMDYNQLFDVMINQEDFHLYNKQLHFTFINHHKLSKIINLFTEIEEYNKRRVCFCLKHLINENSIFQIVRYLQKQTKTIKLREREVMFHIICEIKEILFEKFSILRMFLASSDKNNYFYSSIYQGEIKNTQYLQNFNVGNQKIEYFWKIFENNQNMELEQLVQILGQFTEQDYIIVKSNLLQFTIIESLINKYLKKKTNNYQLIFQIMRKLLCSNLILEQFSQKNKLFSQLFKSLKDDEIFKLISNQQDKQISIIQYLDITQILFVAFSFFIIEQERFEFSDNLFKILELPTNYCPIILHELIKLLIDCNQLKKIYELIYYWQHKETQKLKSQARYFYQNNAQLYKTVFSKLNYFSDDELSFEKMKMYQLSSNIYPQGIEITLEEFNQVFLFQDLEQSHISVQDWLENIKDSDCFKQLIPFFQNIIKRGMPSYEFLSLLNDEVRNRKDLGKLLGYFNQKLMFQIIFNNANYELQVVLLKYWSIHHPIPLVYKNPKGINNQEYHQFAFNIDTFYVYLDSFTLINLSVDAIQERIGKTQLINQIFYESEKFETQDNIALNSETIDIMFDYEFQGSRQLSIADCHGFIDFDILDQILPIFRMWIVQLNTEKEILNTIKALQSLNSFQIKNKIVCLLIRNSCSLLNENQIDQLKKFNIQYIQIVDLADKNLNKEIVENEINKVRKFFYGLINSSRKNQTVTKEQFFHNACRMRNQNQEKINQIQEHISVIQKIKNELEIQIKAEDGFFNKKSFPIRNILWNISKEKLKYIEISEKENFLNKAQILQQINKSIKQLESQIQFQQPSHILSLFCSLFEKSNFYILYLLLIEFLEKFNESHVYLLQDTDLALNQEIIQLKKEKVHLNVQPQNAENDVKLNQIDKEFLNQINQKSLEQRYIEVEVFWREIIMQKELCKNSQIKMDPSEVVCQLIMKGESYQLFDEINQNMEQNVQTFLKKLIEKFQPEGQKKRFFIMSVLESSHYLDNSIILRKIFGFNFETNLRKKKFISFSLLKIQNKNNQKKQFDYCFIFNSGNPKKQYLEDKEFRKKVTLFFLSISDIILANVKGDFNDEFPDLILQSIVTLSRTNFFSFQKQINWCFNLNKDGQNIKQFFTELQVVSKKLSNFNVSFQNFEELFETKIDDRQYLGVPHSEKYWTKDETTGFYSDWKQLIENLQFSEKAFHYGIFVIESYINKSEKIINYYCSENNDISKFLEKITNTWDLIIALPDLIDLSQLLEFEEHQFLQQQFDLLINSRKIDIIDHKKTIHEFILCKQSSIDLEKFIQIENQTLLSIKAELEEKRLFCVEKMKLLTQNKYQLSTDIYKKYLTKVNKQIEYEQNDYTFQIKSDIYNFKFELQKKKGFTILKQFIQELQKSEDMMRYYKSDERLIEKKFTDCWQHIIYDLICYQEYNYEDYQDQLFNLMAQDFQISFSDLRYDTKYFFSNQSKTSPTSWNLDKIFQIIIGNFKSDYKFQIVDVFKKNDEFSQNFHQNIDQKLRNANQVLDLDNIFQYKILITWIQRQDFKTYIETGMLSDLEEYINTKEIANQKDIEHFLFLFTQFEVEINDQNIQSLFESFKQQQFISLKQQHLLSCFIFSSRKNIESTQKQLSVEIILQTCHNFKKYLKSEEIYVPVKGFNQNEIFPQIANFNECCFLLEYQNYGITFLNPFNEKDQNQIKEPNSQEAIDFLKQLQNTFTYILMPTINFHLRKAYTITILEFISKLMNDQEQKRWKKIFEEIYQIIVKELYKEGFEIFSFIKCIIQKTKEKIKQFNLSFSILGVILNFHGERQIWLFVFFVTWSLCCHQFWQLNSALINQAKSQVSEEYTKFKNQIQQDTSQHDQLKGIETFINILDLGVRKYFHKKYQNEFEEMINMHGLKSYDDFMKKLDMDILEGTNSTILPVDILAYAQDQSLYMKRHLGIIINEIEKGIIFQWENYARSFLLKLKANLKCLQNIYLTDDHAEKIFTYLDDQQTCKRLLYQLVLNYLQGQIDPSLLDKLNFQREHFKNDGLYKLNKSFFTFSLSQDCEIHELKHFIRGFKSKLKQWLENDSPLQQFYFQSKMRQKLTQLKDDFLGCSELCPICKRKCDHLTDDNDHKHYCKNGHFILGMNGFFKGNYPILQTCEEIEDAELIWDSITQSKLQWKELKSRYKKWIFSFLKNEEMINQKTKVARLWNNQLGKVICKRSSQVLGINIIYVPIQISDQIK